MISCIAIDDEPLALQVVERFAAQVPFLRLEKTFTDTDEAAKHLRKFPADLLFLDIQMPDINGLEFYRRHAPDKMVIFTTAHSQFAVEGFNVSAIDYLLKPFEFSRFAQAAQKALDYFNYQHSQANSKQRFLFVRSEYSLVKIAFEDIEYIETLDDYLKIHVAGGKPVLTKMNLKNIQSRLDPQEFIRIHRSYIVPVNRIRSVRGKNVRLDELELPIGSTFEEEFFSRFPATDR
jgi:DNA-binding LytR/AlgR family response regulator